MQNYVCLQRIRLHFMKFNLEFGNNGCPYDWVKVYGGSNVNAPLIGTYCGNVVPADILSPANTAFIKFKSDATVRKPGFKIRYSLGETNGTFFLHTFIPA